MLLANHAVPDMRSTYVLYMMLENRGHPPHETFFVESYCSYAVRRSQAKVLAQRIHLTASPGTIAAAGVNDNLSCIACVRAIAERIGLYPASPPKLVSRRFAVAGDGAAVHPCHTASCGLPMSFVS